MTTISFTVKQVCILQAIKDKRPDGEFCDVYDLMELLPYDVKRDALRHSIKILIDAGLVQALPGVKRGGAKRTPFMVTAEGATVV